MSDFNTFSGKTVDEAIAEACRFFATERDRLEVEIISGGSTGIFGLVGKKKAQVRARRRKDPAVTALLAQEEQAALQETAAPDTVQCDAAPRPAPSREGGQDRQRRPRGGRQGGNNGSRQAQPKAERPDRVERAENAERPERQPRQDRDERAAGTERTERAERPARQERPEGRPQNRREARPERPAREPRPPREDHDLDAHPEVDETPASPELLALTREVMLKLLTPILGQEPAMDVEGASTRVSVLIQDEEHSGLLIGREGQTLAALQYLANRIMARKWETPVRVQINTGEYREKQDDSLRKLAVFLADKARNLGKPQSTKPLSSYHRRVVHLALQDDETIQTRSKGEGPMKRVVIVPRRPKPESQPAQ